LLDLLRHVFEEGMDDFCLLSDFSFILLLLLFKLSHEVVDLLFLLIEDLVLLHVISIFFVAHVTLYFFDVPLIGINNFARLCQVLRDLLNLSILLLDAVHEALSSFRERKIHLVGLKL